MKILILLILITNLYSDVKQTMFNLYQNKKYSKVCNIGFNNFKKNKTDEEFISLYAFSCLNSDYIDRLAVPSAMLKFSKESRANSAYFAVILMQKKLLYHSLIDDYNLSALKLPTTEYILSKVFDLYSKLGKHKKRSFYLFEDPNDKKLRYKLYLVESNKVKKMVIEESYNDVSIKKHIFW